MAALAGSGNGEKESPTALELCSPGSSDPTGQATRCRAGLRLSPLAACAGRAASPGRTGRDRGGCSCPAQTGRTSPCLDTFECRLNRRHGDPGARSVGPPECRNREAGVRVVKERDAGVVRRFRLVNGYGEQVTEACRCLEHLADRGSSPHTICAYAYHLRRRSPSSLLGAWTGASSGARTGRLQPGLFTRAFSGQTGLRKTFPPKRE